MLAPLPSLIPRDSQMTEPTRPDIATTPKARAHAARRPNPLLRLILLLGLCASLSACKASKDAPTPESTDPVEAPQTAPAEAVEKEAPRAPSERMEPTGKIKEVQLRRKPGSIVDGDTLRVVEFNKSLRLINIDTEEVFRDRDQKAKAAQSWKAYLAEQTGQGGHRTFATPMGEKALSFARDFFRDVDTLTVEYQSPAHTRGFFDRHLVMVWVKSDRVPKKLVPGAPEGEWLNYNVEAVRAGMSPYYTKYGYSRRLHETFSQAQREAKQNQRGIWAKDAQAYPDYDGRIAWWKGMADQIQKFRAYAKTHPETIDLAADAAFDTLNAKIGERVVVFGEARSFNRNSKPQRLYLNHRDQKDLKVVAFAPVDMSKAGINPRREHYIYVEGEVGTHRGDLEIKYDAKSWMRAGRNPPE